NLLGLGGIEGFWLAAKTWRPGNDRGKHSRQPDVHRVDALPGRLRSGIDARKLLADINPLMRLLHGNTIRWFSRKVSSNQFAKFRVVAATVGHDTVLDRDFFNADVPLARGCLDEQGARVGT